MYSCHALAHHIKWIMPHCCICMIPRLDAILDNHSWWAAPRTTGCPWVCSFQLLWHRNQTRLLVKGQDHCEIRSVSFHCNISGIWKESNTNTCLDHEWTAENFSGRLGSWSVLLGPGFWFSRAPFCSGCVSCWLTKYYMLVWVHCCVVL